MASSVLRGNRLAFFDPFSWLASWPSFAVEESRGHPRVGELFFPAHDSLMNQHRGRAHLLDRTDDQQVVAEARRLSVADVDLDHGIGAAGALELAALVDSDRA